MNPRHPLIKELLSLVEKNNEDQSAKDLSRLLFETANMRSGYHLKVRKMAIILSVALRIGWKNENETTVYTITCTGVWQDNHNSFSPISVVPNNIRAKQYTAFTKLQKQISSQRFLKTCRILACYKMCEICYKTCWKILGASWDKFLTGVFLCFFFSTQDSADFASRIERMLKLSMQMDPDAKPEVEEEEQEEAEEEEAKEADGETEEEEEKKEDGKEEETKEDGKEEEKEEDGKEEESKEGTDDAKKDEGESKEEEKDETVDEKKEDKDDVSIFNNIFFLFRNLDFEGVEIRYCKCTRGWYHQTFLSSHVMARNCYNYVINIIHHILFIR